MTIKTPGMPSPQAIRYFICVSSLTFMRPSAAYADALDMLIASLTMSCGDLAVCAKLAEGALLERLSYLY